MLLRGHAGEHTGYVLDGAVEEDFMAGLDCVRNALPVDKDKKKTDAARRFFCAEGDKEWIRLGIVRALEESLAREEAERFEVRVLPWMRFLEYSEPNGALPPHTDALIRCKETNAWSTHTFLVFCSDCSVGGETVLLPEEPKALRNRNRNVLKALAQAEGLRTVIAGISADGADTVRLSRLRAALEVVESRAVEESPAPGFSVQPRRGRIFFFPHACPHEGRPTVSVPKILLRAEVILSRVDETRFSKVPGGK